MSPVTKQYFPEIDGVRALAVLAVIFFHLQLPGFQGGYVGVDVFFVISGFLITRNILFDISRDQFSFGRFYMARFRRLGPALIATIALTLCAGVLLLSPDALIRLSGSAIASIVSLANVRFWLVSGYFDVDAALKPLLHFWSLSVEEQFYLFWPFILVFGLKLFSGRTKGLLLLSIILLLSFTAGQIMLHRDPSMAFYWVQFRAYEFALGAVFVWLELYFPLIRESRFKNSNLLMVLGLVMIAYSVTTYSKTTLFPGFASLLPCLGTFLLIYARGSAGARLVLTNVPARFTGKISYSLYLVHWPIWVFASHWLYRDFQLIEKAVLLVFIFTAGYALHVLVEKRFRYGSTQAQRSNRALVLVSSLMVVILMSVSWQIRVQGGWTWRIDNSYQPLEKAQINCEISDKKRRQDCHFGEIGVTTANILLLGDSHSMNLRYGFDSFGREAKIGFRSISFAGCPPLIGVELRYSNGSEPVRDCLEFSDRVKREIESGAYDAIVFSSRWMWLYEHQPYTPGLKIPKAYLATSSNSDLSASVSRRLWKDALIKTVKFATDHNAKVIVMSQYPLLGSGIGECDKSPSYLIDPKQNSERCAIGVSYAKLMQRLEFTNNTINSLVTERVMIVLPSDYLCDHSAQTCNVLTENGLLYSDENHLSRLGSKFLIDSISSDLLNFL